VSIISSSNNDNTVRPGRCSLCGREDRLVEEVEVYYRKGEKMRLANLCYDEIQPQQKRTFFITPVDKFDDDDCYCRYKYFRDLGFTLIVAGWFQETYDVIRSVYISSPLLFPKASSTSSAAVITTTTSKLRGGIAIPFDTAVHTAYMISHIARQYISAVDKDKVPDIMDVVMNPRLWSIRYKLACDPIIEQVSAKPLIFRWNMFSSYYF
jgi:hypothetical protein